MNTEPTHLLITDDDPDFRSSLAQLLSRRGFKPLEAASGREALDVIQSRQVSLMMVDMHMPEMTGLETLAEIHRLQIQLPSILMSAQLDNRIVKEAADLVGQENVLAKPFPIRVLDTMLQRLLPSAK